MTATLSADLARTRHVTYARRSSVSRAYHRAATARPVTLTGRLATVAPAERFAQAVRPAADFEGKRTRSTQVVSTRPAMKSGLRKIRRCSGMVVLTPSMTSSSRARRMVARASRRVGAWTISLPSERVVVRGDGIADLDVRIPADAGAAGDPQAR